MLQSIIPKQMETARDFAEDGSMLWLPAELWLHIFKMLQRFDDYDEEAFLDRYLGRDKPALDRATKYIRSLYNYSAPEKYEKMCALRGEQHPKICLYRTSYKCFSLPSAFDDDRLYLEERLYELISSFEDLVYNHFFYMADQLTFEMTHFCEATSQKLDTFYRDICWIPELDCDTIDELECRIYYMLFFIHVYYPYMRFHDTSYTEKFKQYFYEDKQGVRFLWQNSLSKPENTPFTFEHSEWPEFPITNKEDLAYIKRICDDYTIRTYDPEYYESTYQYFKVLRSGKCVIPKGGIPSYKWHCNKYHRLHAPLLE